MVNTQVRVVGSGYTTFHYGGAAIAFCESVQDSGARAFSDTGQPYEFIQPLGNRYPAEIATSRVLQGGTLQLTIRELWNQAVWEQLGSGSSSLAGTNNIVEIFERMAADPSYVQCRMVIKPPGTTKQSQWRGKIFHNCVVVDINDSDTLTIGALSVTKGITVAYTHYTPLNKTTSSS